MGVEMERKQVGGGLLAAAGVCGPWIAQMMGLTVSPLIGYALLVGCALVAVGGLWMLFRGARTVAHKGKEAKRDKSYLETGRTAGIHVMPGAKFGGISNVTVVGFDDGIVNEGQFGFAEDSHIQGHKPNQSSES